MPELGSHRQGRGLVTQQATGPRFSSLQRFAKLATPCFAHHRSARPLPPPPQGSVVLSISLHLWTSGNQPPFSEGRGSCANNQERVQRGASSKVVLFILGISWGTGSGKKSKNGSWLGWGVGANDAFLGLFEHRHAGLHTGAHDLSGGRTPSIGREYIRHPLAGPVETKD